MTPRKEIRSMKARRDGRLACGHYAHQGELIIGRGTGWRRAWICEQCNRAEQAGKSKISAEGKRP